jgi:hypothetical protein
MSTPLETFDALIAGFRGHPHADTDWQAVLRLANQSLTVTTLAARLRDHAAIVPDEVSQFLGAIVARNRRRNARMRAQLAEATALLAAEGIAAVAIKGAAILATATDRTLGDRILSDIDLLVAPADFDRAQALLVASGYALSPASNRRALVAVLGRPDHVGTIDLHGHIAGLNGFDPMAGARPVSVDGTTVLVPSPTAQILVLLAHDILRGKDYLWGLFDLRHLADMDDLARSDDPPDWDAVSAALPAWITTALRTQLLSLRRLLHCSVSIRCSKLWRARLHFHRRRLQIAYPRLMPALVIASIASDPFFLSARRATLTGGRTARPRSRFRPASMIGKV